ncbi:MAG TPA: hypothetical protein VHD63_24600, partial [Ktedonobacteraceae bacterium]|nr:hypothetical protein [Ktedonobacteraceae bacterium]
MQDLILVLSSPNDFPACQVVEALQRRQKSVLLFDPGDFPLSVTIDAAFGGTTWEGRLGYQGAWYDMTRIASLLYRRPTFYRVDPSLPPQIQRFAEQEAHHGFGGILRALPPGRWVSHPDALRAAAFKPRQLQIAAQLGLRTPRTLVTNDPDALRRFYEECEGQIIYKTLSRGNIAVDRQRYDAIFTSQVQAEHLDKRARVCQTAHLFQEVIEKAFELRLTVVGKQVFAAAVYSQHADTARLDFRNGYDVVRYAVYKELPPEIEAACLGLVQAYGLAYGAIDMAVTPTGEYVFFEINGAGQYQWIEV